ncbi:MAG: hypothetical protein MJ237_01850 [bacterium]|nr:hypothetical protein [bacterium]
MVAFVGSNNYHTLGKLYAGMTKESILADISSMSFKSEAERKKAYNKQIKLFDYANNLVEGETNNVISERELEAYNKKEKTKKALKTAGLIIAGIGIAVTAAIIFHKVKNSKVTKTITEAVSESTTPPSARIASFSVKTHPCENLDDWREIKQDCRKYHEKRMALYSSPEATPNPSFVSLEKINAMNDVQCEMGEYIAVQEKMRKGIELNEAERNFYERIVSQMDTTTQERTLWRILKPYEGFEQEIRSGQYKFKGFTSTSSRYTDFFDFWDSCGYNAATKSIAEGYMLQITVPTGKKLLDCNAVSKNLLGKILNTKMRDEVILPEGVAQIIDIDNALNIIKMRLL